MGLARSAHRFMIGFDVEEDSEWGCWDVTEIYLGTPECLMFGYLSNAPVMSRSAILVEEAHTLVGGLGPELFLVVRTRAGGLSGTSVERF